MKKTIGIFILLTLFSLLYAQADFRSLANVIVAKATAANLKRLAVASFSVSKEEAKQIADYAQDDLIFALVEEGSLEILEREELEKILKEKALEQAGLIDENNSQQIGQWLGVDGLILGKVSLREQNEIVLQLRLVEVSTTKIVATFNRRLAVMSRPDIATLPVGEPVIQLAILLDTSNSMDGLINQARAYLWKIVNELALAKQNNKTPAIEVALYEYGNDSLPAKENYLRLIVPFTRELDKIAEELFALTTNGGEEYVGAVVRHAVENLAWSNHPAAYRAIFVAGNEGFAQGKVAWQDSIALAKQKGIYVNTIYCGPKQSGIALGWQAGAIAGGGSYAHIEQEAVERKIATPYDREIEQAGLALNHTYIPYGEAGQLAAKRQKEIDQKVEAMSETTTLIERQIYKAKSQGITSWDLVSEIQEGRLSLDKIDQKKLPTEYQNFSSQELAQKIQQKLKERSELQKKIQELEKKRKQYLAEQEKKQVTEQTLDRVLLRTIRYQAKRQHFYW